jgi:hypothetical protein
VGILCQALLLSKFYILTSAFALILLLATACQVASFFHFQKGPKTTDIFLTIVSGKAASVLIVDLFRLPARLVRCFESDFDQLLSVQIFREMHLIMYALNERL